MESVYRSLPPEDQARAVIYCPSYGQAGAVELFGDGEAAPATVIGAVVAAGIGAALTRWCAIRMDWEPAWRTWTRLVGAVILMAALSVTAGAVAIDWPLTHVEDRYGHVPPPWIGVGVLVGAIAVLVASLRADWAALARLRAATAGADVEEREAAEGARDLPRLDLGLGDDVRALVARGSATYRSSERTLALVVGDPGEAASALRRALRRDVLGLAVAAMVIGVHAVAACAVGCALPFQGMRCTARAVWDPVETLAARP